MVVVGHFTSATSSEFVSNSILVKHSATYTAQYPGRVKANTGTRLLMVDAHLGAIGVWLAFVASVVGAAVIAVGLLRDRHAVAAPSTEPKLTSGTLGGRAGVGMGDGRHLAPVMLVGAVLAAVRHGARAGHPRLQRSSSWPRTTAR